MDDEHRLYHVVAMARNRVIGKDNKLPWHFPADLKYFKQLTTGSTVIMGRKTFESIGKPLPDRENFVLTSRPSEDRKNLRFFSSMEAVLENVATRNAYIIGGENVYKQTMDLVDGVYMTLIDRDYEGDAYYPELPPLFREESRTVLQEANPLIEVVVYEKL